MSRLFFVASLLACASGLPKFQQNSYKLLYERGEVIDYNRKYFSYFKIHNFKYNRTQAVNNGTFTIIRDINSHLKMQVEAYKFASNEYRGFPLLFSYGFCEGINKDDFGMQASLSCGNISLRNVCPVFKKNTYFLCNFKPDEEKCPPHMPEGSYMLDLKWFHGPTEILFLQSYFTIKNKDWW